MDDHLKNVFDHYTTVLHRKSILKNFFVDSAELSRFMKERLGKLTIWEVYAVQRKGNTDNVTIAYTIRKGELPIRSDVNGSYTGCTVDPHDIPVQDADDL
jgi:hypothetical protein